MAPLATSSQKAVRCPSRVFDALLEVVAVGALGAAVGQELQGVEQDACKQGGDGGDQPVVLFVDSVEEASNQERGT